LTRDPVSRRQARAARAHADAQQGLEVGA